jgi:hypothetical protein
MLLLKNQDSMKGHASSKDVLRQAELLNLGAEIESDGDSIQYFETVD